LRLGRQYSLATGGRAVADNEARENRPIHVTPREDGWAVVREGNKKVSAVHPTRHQAEEHGRSLARKSRADFVLHDKDGNVLVHDFYGEPHGGEVKGVHGEKRGRLRLPARIPAPYIGKPPTTTEREAPGPLWCTLIRRSTRVTQGSGKTRWDARLQSLTRTKS
jgi:hypothetical protein